MNEYDRLIKLPKKGRLLVFTDVHGNYDDYQKYLEKWDEEDSDCHIVIAGDFIHNTSMNDYSVEILEDIMDKDKKYDNFHVLLGNHELSHIIGKDIYKYEINQRKEFEDLIVEKKGSLEPYLSEYVNFFKTLPFFLQTDNGVFISHASPSSSVKDYDDFLSILEEKDYNDEKLYSVLWNRHLFDYSESDVSSFLDIVDSKVIVVGHSVVNGYKLFGKQMILSSSFGTQLKLYLDIDLTENVEDTNYLFKYLKPLWGY